MGEIFTYKTDEGTVNIIVEDLTPNKAEKYLKSNTQNRKLNQKRVDVYKNDMINGRWKQNGIPIIIGDDGILKDGQHRLSACMRSGITLKNQLVIIMPQKQANCYDIGLARSVKDIALLEGFDDTLLKNNSIASMMNYCIKNGMKVDVPPKMMTIEYIEKYHDACQWVYDNFLKKSAKFRGLSSAGTAAAVLNAYLNQYPLSKLEMWCDILINGIPTNEKDFGILRYRDYLLTACGGSGARFQRDTYFRAQSSLRNYEKGKIVGKCVPSTTEFYRFPEMEA